MVAFPSTARSRPAVLVSGCFVVAPLGIVSVVEPYWHLEACSWCGGVLLSRRGRLENGRREARHGGDIARADSLAGRYERHLQPRRYSLTNASAPGGSATSTRRMMRLKPRKGQASLWLSQSRAWQTLSQYVRAPHGHLHGWRCGMGNPQ